MMTLEITFIYVATDVDGIDEGIEQARLAIADQRFEPASVETSGRWMSRPYMRDFYLNGQCPDCATEIPVNADDGDACAECGHVFRSDDDRLADAEVRLNDMEAAYDDYINNKIDRAKGK